MTSEELKIYQEELRKSPKDGKRRAIKRFVNELKLGDMEASVIACQCEVYLSKKDEKTIDSLG
jgi:hypothetical protein